MDDFATIYEQERPRVFAYLLGRTGNWHIAEDITSEVFEVAWREWESWEDRGIPYSHYLRRIAYWHFGLYWKKEKRWRRLMSYHPYLSQHEFDGTGTADDVLDKCHTAMSYALLEAALCKLRPRQLTAIALRYGRALPEKEAARRMGIGFEAYHALHTNALGRLRDLLVGRTKPRVRGKNDPTTPTTCQIEGCGRPHYARDKCRRHWKQDYRRQRRESHAPQPF